MPRLLSEDPEKRPANLSELVKLLRSAPAVEREKADEPEAPPRRTRSRVLLTLAGSAAVAAAVVGYFVFSNRSAPSATDDFDAVFSVRGIYEGARQ